MKKLLIIIFLLAASASFAQVSDATMNTYNDTYMIENNTNSITATMVNTLYGYLIDSKVNKDSATVVRWSTEYDTCFVTWYGRSEDTLFFYVENDNTADQDTIHMGDEIFYVNTSVAQDSTWVQIFVDSLGGIGNCVTKAYIDTIVGCSPVYVSGGLATTTVVTTALGTSGSHTENAYIDTIPLGTVFSQDIEVDGGWQDWTPSLTWTGTAPTVNGTIARYMRVNNTVFYDVLIQFTTGGTTPTALDFTLPTTPKDIGDPLIFVGFLSRTGSDYEKRINPYIDANTPVNKIYCPAFSIVAASTYYWSFSGHFEIE